MNGSSSSRGYRRREVPDHRGGTQDNGTLRVTGSPTGAFMGGGDGGWENSVWRTHDAGVTWRPAMGEGELSPVAGIDAALAQHPLHPDWLYAGTDVGVFVSHDFGATWSATSEGPANVIVYQLEFLRGSSTTLLAGTYGRGLWTIDIP